MRINGLSKPKFSYVVLFFPLTFLFFMWICKQNPLTCIDVWMMKCCILIAISALVRSYIGIIGLRSANAILSAIRPAMWNQWRCCCHLCLFQSVSYMSCCFHDSFNQRQWCDPVTSSVSISAFDESIGGFHALLANNWIGCTFIFFSTPQIFKRKNALCYCYRKYEILHD